MFLRPHYRWRDGQREAYWALVESYRTERGPRQRTVAYLGLMDEAGRLGVEQAADPQPPTTQQPLFSEAKAEPRFVEIDRTRVRVENCRQLGAPWLALELAKRLGLHELLERTLAAGQEHVPWSLTALILVIARFCEPSSELHIAEHFYRQSALCDLLGVPVDKVDDNRLYRGLDELLPHKPALEMFLKQRFGELFAIEYDLLLYAVTSTYFEGQAKANPWAKHGYSRDHRPDCKQVCIGLVVTRCGLPLGYEVFAGNRHDSTTLEEIVETMEARYGQAQRIWALDRGMVSEDNLDFLKAGQRQYIVGTPKSQLKRFEQQLAGHDWHAIREGLEVKLCPCPDGRNQVAMIKANVVIDKARRRSQAAFGSPTAVTLVDDVVTRGATFVGLLPHLEAAFPGGPIHCFALVRTMSYGEISQIRDAVEGVVTFEHGNLHRQP
jgi:Transposase DDE domain